LRGFVYEWRNPKTNYYPCYWRGEGKNNDVLIHRDLAEKEIFLPNRYFFSMTYPGKSFNELLVHHVDKDIFNYDYYVIMSEWLTNVWDPGSYADLDKNGLFDIVPCISYHVRPTEAADQIQKHQEEKQFF
jgi:hypothetical protein